jgi:competence protein ComGC
MKLSPLIFSVLLIACCPSLADQNERFVEFQETGTDHAIDIALNPMILHGQTHGGIAQGRHGC